MVCGAIPVCEYVQRGCKLGQSQLIPTRLRAFHRTIYKLAKGDGRDADIRNRDFLKPFYDIRWFPFDDIDAYMGIEHVCHEKVSLPF